MNARSKASRWSRRRQRGQALVEATYTAVLLVVVLGLVLEIALWGQAQNVATMAVQDGARVAAAQGGDLARGRARAYDLLTAGLGASSGLVTITADQDGQSVRFVATGEWSVISGRGVDLGFPISAESRMLKHEWQP